MTAAAPERARWPRLAATPQPPLRSLLPGGYGGAWTSPGVEGWTGGRVAAEAGYADQAHLVRDFRQFTGTTSTRFRDQMRPADGTTRHVELPRWTTTRRIR